MKSLKGVAAALALASFGGPALADRADAEADILGSWTFETVKYRGGQCQLRGSMRLASSPEPGLFACELTALEECDDLGQSIVVQTCEARLEGDRLTVDSSVQEMIEKKIQGLVYVPDNFDLDVVSGNLMTGLLVSAVTADVEFRRAIEGIS